MAIRKNRGVDPSLEVAANGLIHRRALLGRGVLIAGAMGSGFSNSLIGAAAEPLPVDAWSLEIGAAIPPYDRPAKYEKNVVRTLTNPKNEPRTSQARTPHHLLNGTITPNGLHFVVSRTGFPDIDPYKHRLVIHGLVKQPLVFTLETLARYPMVSRINFVEAAATARHFTIRIQCRPTCRRSTASSPAPSGRAFVFPLCSKRPASTRRRSGCLPKAPTARA